MAKSTSTDVVKAETPHYPVPVGEKPLTATQLKNLERLVNMDFDDLREAVINDISQRASRKQEAIDKKYGDQSTVKRALDEANAFVDKQNAAAAEYFIKLTAKYPGLRFPDSAYMFMSTSRVLVTPEQAGRDEAVRRLNMARTRVLNMADTIINREQRKVQRIVLLQGTTPTAAQELLSDLPDPQDIATLLMSELALGNQDDIDILMAED